MCQPFTCISYLLRLKIDKFSDKFSVVPDLWKHATIIPLYKGKGLDKASPTSYRPVALTSPIAKLAEKFIYDDLKPFLEN